MGPCKSLCCSTIVMHVQLKAEMTMHKYETLPLKTEGSLEWKVNATVFTVLFVLSVFKRICCLSVCE